MILTIVPTPIGNLEDITLRSIRALTEADLILAEDTRKTGILLKHLGLSKSLQSYHAHNEHQIVTKMVVRIKNGEKIALVSDAGTPAISDPGFLLVRECLKQGIEISCLPGATAFVPALVNSGIPSDKFVFEGFLPQKKGRQTRLEILSKEDRTMIFYESPHRLVKALEQFIQHFGEDRQACVCREISKIYEENVRGTLSEILANFAERTVKGEIVIVVAGK
jgi:16S rRNA (cytidine1402-2'-O)-methyltransferase